MVQCSMVAAACSEEEVEGRGLASDTCYQVMGEVAKGVTECASSGAGKETVTTECKMTVRPQRRLRSVANHTRKR